MELLPTMLEPELIGNKLRNFIAESIPQLGVPIISRGENWARVNDLVILDDSEKFRVSKRGIKIAEFSRKSWAIAYAVAYCRGASSTCRFLLEQEQRINKYGEDIERYTYNLKQARLKNDTVRERILDDRLSRTYTDYSTAIEEVSELVKSQYVG